MISCARLRLSGANEKGIFDYPEFSERMQSISGVRRTLGLL